MTRLIKCDKCERQYVTAEPNTLVDLQPTYSQSLRYDLCPGCTDSLIAFLCDEDTPAPKARTRKPSTPR